MDVIVFVFIVWCVFVLLFYYYFGFINVKIDMLVFFDFFNVIKWNWSCGFFLDFLGYLCIKVGGGGCEVEVGWEEGDGYGFYFLL